MKKKHETRTSWRQYIFSQNVTLPTSRKSPLYVMYLSDAQLKTCRQKQIKMWQEDKVQSKLQSLKQGEDEPKPLSDCDQLVHDKSRFNPVARWHAQKEAQRG